MDGIGTSRISCDFGEVSDHSLPMTVEYLSVTDVAKRLGISTAAVSAYKLPQPDATIGRTRGWLPETIDQWNAQRPGRGVGGGRPRKHPAE